MMMPRLFVGIALPEAVRRDLASVMEGLEGVRWSPPENLHLTLRYIGETEPERQERMEQALGRVRVEPFVLPVEGLGLFPSRGAAKVLWAGLGGAHTRLFQLRKQVDEALLAVDLTLEVRSFQPHVTLGRLTETHDRKALERFLRRHAEFEAAPFRVAEFHLFASDGGGAGRAPRYRVLRTFALEK